MEPCAHRIVIVQTENEKNDYCNFHDYTIHYLSIDFEPIEVRFSIGAYAKFLSTISKYGCYPSETEVYQGIVDTACVAMGKPIVEVECFTSNQVRDINKFGQTIMEFVGNGSFGRVYFLRTKTHMFNNYQYWQDVIKDGNGHIENLKFHAHYREVGKYLLQQGLTLSKRYYEVTDHTINQFINILKKPKNYDAGKHKINDGDPVHLYGEAGQRRDRRTASHGDGKADRTGFKPVKLRVKEGSADVQS